MKDELFSVLCVAAGCAMIGLATRSFLIGIGLWLCIGGIVICLKAWFKQGVR